MTLSGDIRVADVLVPARHACPGSSDERTPQVVRCRRCSTARVRTGDLDQRARAARDYAAALGIELLGGFDG